VSGQLPWTDSNDTLMSFMSVMPKNVDNLVSGQSTYGFFEYVCFLDATFYDLWVTAADGWGLGLGLGLIASSFCTRLLFVPTTIYGQSCGMKMKLMQPDQEEITAAIKRYGA